MVRETYVQITQGINLECSQLISALSEISSDVAKLSRIKSSPEGIASAKTIGGDIFQRRITVYFQYANVPKWRYSVGDYVIDPRSDELIELGHRSFTRAEVKSLV